MTQAVYRSILAHLTWQGTEEGGLLIGPKDSDIVTSFLSDNNARRTSVTFTIDSIGLNERLREFLALGYDAKGFVHSHPPGYCTPSAPDREYVAETLAKPKNANCHTYLLPIVCDGQLWPYVIFRDESRVVQRAELEIL